LVVGVAMLLLNEHVARAREPECNVEICTGSAACKDDGGPCTITGHHVLTLGCDLNFGLCDVTVAPGASLEADLRILGIGVFSIEAHDLTNAGLITERGGGFVDLTVSGNIRVDGRININGDGGTLTIIADGSVLLAGQGASADGGSESGGTIDVTGASVTVEAAVGP
jgi:hypothetical protein